MIHLKLEVGQRVPQLGLWSNRLGVARNRILNLVPRGLRANPNVAGDTNVKRAFEPAKPDADVFGVVIRPRVEGRSAFRTKCLEKAWLVWVFVFSDLVARPH